jgi:hypothetical protein
MTATRSVKWAAVARSWVMKRIEMPRLVRSWASRLRISARM